MVAAELPAKLYHLLPSVLYEEGYEYHVCTTSKHTKVYIGRDSQHNFMYFVFALIY